MLVSDVKAGKLRGIAVTSAPAEFGMHIHTEIAKRAPLIKAAGLKVD
jgi:hypothetical protein